MGRGCGPAEQVQSEMGICLMQDQSVPEGSKGVAIRSICFGNPLDLDLIYSLA